MDSNALIATGYIALCGVTAGIAWAVNTDDPDERVGPCIVAAALMPVVLPFLLTILFLKLCGLCK